MPNEKKSILQPKNDVVFKALFSRGKPRITQAMLEAILKMKIDKLELDKSTDLLNENADDKNGRLDLRAIINGNTECDIEVQLVSNDNITERFLYYWAKMYAANLKIGDKYSDLRKTISIIILDDDFKLTKNLERPQTTWRIRESEATHLVLTDYFEIIIIEIPKVVKAYKKTPNDEVLQWMLFLDNPEKEEVTRIMEENKDIKEAKEELERISQDDILRRKALNRTLEIADKLQLKKEAKEAREKGEQIMLLEIIGAILSMVGSWMIFKKMGRQGWEGIVPIYSTYVLCKVLYGNGWKFLLLLIPFYNIYFAIKMMVDLAKAFNQGVGFAIGLLLLPFVFNLILAFGGAQYMDGSFANTQPDMVEDVVNKARDAVSGDQNDR